MLSPSAAVVAAQQGADAEQDQIGRSRELEDGEGDHRAIEQFGDPQGGGHCPGQDAETDAARR